MHKSQLLELLSQSRAEVFSPTWRGEPFAFFGILGAGIMLGRRRAGPSGKPIRASGLAGISRLGPGGRPGVPGAAPNQALQRTGQLAASRPAMPSAELDR